MDTPLDIQVHEELEQADKHVGDTYQHAMVWFYLARAAIKALLLIAQSINNLPSNVAGTINSQGEKNG